jgi:two-component system, NtrC family, sensor histidine kinase PilS
MSSPVVGRWIIALRLFTYMLVTGSVIITLGSSDYWRGPILLYSALSLYWPVAAIWKRIRLPEPSHRFVILCQLVTELIIEVAIVNTTGAAVSPFTGLFYLTIISGALTFNLIGALGLASLAAFGHLIVNWFGYSLGELARIDGGLWSALKKAPDEAFFAGLLSVLSFYATAFVAGYFSERLRNKDEELASASVALSRVRMQTDEIVRRLSAGLLTIDRSGRIILFNEFAESIFGIKEELIRGADFRKVFRGGFAEFGKELALAFDNGASRPRMEVLLTREDGSSIPLGVSTATISAENDEASSLIAIFQDITGAKAMEEKARQSDRLMAVAELSAAMAHEIRNPLAAIAGSAQMLASDLDLCSEERKLFDLILKESARLNTLLSDFLSYARANPVALTKVELCHNVAEAMEMMRRHPSFAADVAFTFDSQASVTYVVGSAGQIRQIVFNLLLNAFEALANYSGPDKKVAVEISRDEDSGKVLLSIGDNGPGIPKERVNDIFAPFYSTKPAGTGLGLAIVHRLAESMSVDLDLQTIEGAGATIRLRFAQFGIQQETDSPSLSEDAYRERPPESVIDTSG